MPARIDSPALAEAPRPRLGRRATLYTVGCRLNQAESMLIRDRLEAGGWEIVPFGERADLAIINTCTVTDLADAKSRQIIRGFTRRNPQAFTAVVGCYSESGARAIASIPGVDLIVGNQEKLQVLNYVHEGKSDRPIVIRDRLDRSDFSISFVGDAPFNKRANLKVQDGCDFVCSFCIIPFVRGRARSRDLANLLAEARSLVARGARELVLTGINLGTFRSGDSGLVEMIDRLAALRGLSRLRISSIEPTTVPEGLLERMADPNHPLQPFLHLPLQSGSDRVLREMRRRHTVADYLEFARLAVTTVPDLYLATDLMVGFPGETPDEFEQTCRVFCDGPFAFCHVFPYSEREGTLAARRSDQLPVPERDRRSARLRRLAASKRHDYYSTHLGREMEVLFEDPKPGLWPGYTANFIRVCVDAAQSPGEDLANRLARVRLDRVEADFVSGTLLT